MSLKHILTIAAAVTATVALMPQTASAERVCRQECVGPVCSEKCIETEGRLERRDGVEIRREGREERREGREERRELEGRGPGLELRAPGVDVEIGGRR
jgi:hypothetical protein